MPKGYPTMRRPRSLLLLLLVLALAASFASPAQARLEPAAPIAAAAPARPAAPGVRVVRYARRLLGVPYRWGGGSPRSGFDCSGLVRYVYGHFGVRLAHSSYADYWRGRHVGRWAMKPGDLVFFDDAGHVGIYVGKGRFIHAPHTGTVVRIETMAGWYSSRFDGARRLLAR